MDARTLLPPSHRKINTQPRTQDSTPPHYKFSLVVLCPTSSHLSHSEFWSLSQLSKTTGKIICISKAKKTQRDPHLRHMIVKMSREILKWQVNNLSKMLISNLLVISLEKGEHKKNAPSWTKLPNNMQNTQTLNICCYIKSLLSYTHPHRCYNLVMFR